MNDEVREALDRLAGDLQVPKGGIRIFAHFRRGLLVRPVKVSVFRVPPHLASTIGDIARQKLNQDVLEDLCRELHLDEHVDVELIVEYFDGRDGTTVRWLDCSMSD